MNYLFALLFLMSGVICHSQTLSELQSKFERERNEIARTHVQKIEVYQFDNRRDSTLRSFQTFDTLGNLLSARHYKYKNRKYYSEEHYEYDSLGRRISYTSSSTYLDKLNKAKVKTVERYYYTGESMTNRILDSYENDSLVSRREFPGKPYIRSTTTKEQRDSSGHIVAAEFNGPVGSGKASNTYTSAGNVQSSTFTSDGHFFHEFRYNDSGDIVEHKTLYYKKDAPILVEHALIYYDAENRETRTDYLNKKGKVTSQHKCYYYTYR